MTETLLLYSQNEVIAIFKLFMDLFGFIVFTSIGVFTKELIFPEECTKRENFGLAILAGIISFAISVFYHEQLTVAGETAMFLLSVTIGFFISSFKNWFKDKTFFRIISKAIKNTNMATTSILDEIDKELNKDE